MKHTWTVSDMPIRKRLDVFISEQLPEVTRSQIAKILKSKGGTVNGKQATVHEF